MVDTKKAGRELSLGRASVRTSNEGTVVPMEPIVKMRDVVVSGDDMIWNACKCVSALEMGWSRGSLQGLRCQGVVERAGGKEEACPVKSERIGGHSLSVRVRAAA